MVELKLKSGATYLLNTIKSVEMVDDKEIEIVANLEPEGAFKTFLLAINNIEKKSLRKILKYEHIGQIEGFLFKL
jgi:hypothetical protein